MTANQLSLTTSQKLPTEGSHTSFPEDLPVIDAHVVILNNYIRVHHAVSYLELAKRVRKLTILLSVPMEPDRDWEADWMGLDVRVQKNWMFTKTWRHSLGFKEQNFIHVPVDTVKQLKVLDPDVVFSYEMGFRTLLAGWFRRWRKKVALVMVGNMSAGIEQERGWARRSLRSLIRRGVDYCSYNGPSCKRYLQGIGVPEDRLFHVPYCIDDKVVCEESRPVRSPDQPIELLYSGSISRRKGIIEFAQILKRWCDDHPRRTVVLKLAGAGDVTEKVLEIGADNLLIQHLGMLDQSQLRLAYGSADVCVNPTFADEWGLTTIEALASGVPVLGCTYAQSVEAVVKDGFNGWTFQTDVPDSVYQSVDAMMDLDHRQLADMEQRCRQSVAHITPAATAERFCDVVRHALQRTKRGTTP